MICELVFGSMNLVWTYIKAHFAGFDSKFTKRTLSSPIGWTFSSSLHTLWVPEANKMHDCISVWINCKNTGSYLFIAKGAHAVGCDLHIRFSLAIQFIFSLQSVSKSVRRSRYKYCRPLEMQVQGWNLSQNCKFHFAYGSNMFWPSQTSENSFNKYES